MAGHDVILTGETTTGFDEIAAAVALSRLFKLQPNQAKAVAAGSKRRRVARGISPARAAQLTETIRALGIEVTITPPIAAPRTPRLALEDEADFRSEDTQDGPADEPLTLAPIETRHPQPPADDVEESPVPRSPEARSVGAMGGARWLMAGFEVLKGNPLGWIGASTLLIVVDAALALVPLVGPTVSTIAYPVLLGGLMLGAHNEYETGLFEITCVFEGAARQPIRLGLLGIAFWVVAAMPPLIMEGLLTFLNGMPTLFAAAGLVLLLTLPTMGLIILATPLAALGVGILVALPVILAAGYAAYRDVYG